MYNNNGNSNEEKYELSERKRSRHLEKKILIILFTIMIVILGSIIVVSMFNIKSRKESKNVSVEAKENSNHNITNKSSNDKNNEQQESDSKKNEENSLVVKGKNYSKEGEKYADDPAKVQEIIKTGKNDGKKVVYLTFDDGPSVANTSAILDILKEKDVKATFFILGQELNTEKDAEVIKREVKEGHAIGNHTFCHDYKKLYPGRHVDTKYFMEDIEKNNNKLKSILGDEFHTNIVRMPGGHMSWKGTSELDKVFEEKKYYSIDWNAMTGDAENGYKTKDGLIQYFKNSIVNKESFVVLMHDTHAKKSTVEALPYIIDYLKSEGYEFRTIG